MRTHPPATAGPPASTRRRRAAIVATVVTLGALASAAPGTAASCPGIDTPVAEISGPQAEYALLCLSNVARAAVGQSPLTTDPRLAVAARRHVRDMVERQYFAHVAPAPAPFGTDMAARAQAAGYPFRTLGENLASGQPTPRRAVEAWLRSPGHCRNLLDPTFDEIGHAQAASAPVWAQLLGTRSGGPEGTPDRSCDATPPTVAGVTATAPSAEPDDAATGVRILKLDRQRSVWLVTLSAGHAEGRVVTAGLYASTRECAAGARCANVPGRRLATHRTTLDGRTTVRLRRLSAGSFVTVRLSPFSRQGVRYGATTVTRRLPD